jgi:hypothetical protein
VVPKKTNKASVKAKAKVMNKNAKKSDTGVSKKATAKATAPKKATAKAAAPKKATAKAAAPKTASAKAAAKLRRLKDTSHVVSRKNKKANTTMRLFHPTKTELHKGKPIKKLMNPTKKYIYVAPKVEQQYWDKAYKLFDTNVTTCDAWFKAQKGTVAEKLQRYKSEVLTLKGTPCEKFAYQLSVNAVNINVLTDLWKWQNDEWKNTYSLFKAIGNSVSLYKWNSYMSSLCYRPKKIVVDGEVVDAPDAQSKKPEPKKKVKNSLPGKPSTADAIKKNADKVKSEAQSKVKAEKKKAAKAKGKSDKKDAAVKAAASKAKVAVVLKKSAPKKQRNLQKTASPVIKKVVVGDNTVKAGPKVNVQGWTLTEDPKGINAMNFVTTGFKNPGIQAGLISHVAGLMVIAITF